jgi:hypothetical protein
MTHWIVFSGHVRVSLNDTPMSFSPVRSRGDWSERVKADQNNETGHPIEAGRCGSPEADPVAPCR